MDMSGAGIPDRTGHRRAGAGGLRAPAAPGQAEVATPPATAPAVDARPGSAVRPTGGAAGVRVFIDPATGEARAPTRARAAAAAAAGAGADQVQAAGGVGQAASEGVQREHFVLPDGTEGVKLLPRDRHAVVVCRQADGSYGSDCPKATGAAAP
ncbi:MAG: hypothetical protein U1F67_00890 [Rubrivivax sp.]